MRTTVNETIRRQHVNGQSDHQQAGGPDVRGLKVPVPWPKPPAQCRTGRHGKKEQREERQDSGVFVTRRGQLDMLDHAMIGAEQYSHVENRGGER